MESVTREDLNKAYPRFLAEEEPERKNQAGEDLIRAIFGGNAIAEDSAPSSKREVS